MIWSVPALKDTTIYESDPYRNSGLDQVLELRKIGDTTTNDLEESRILIQFDISDLSNVLTANNITINDISASLNLYSVQVSEVPTTYTIESKALAVSWSNGTGYSTTPSGEISAILATDGATWFSTAGSGSLTWSASLSDGTQIQYNSASEGGGVWYTSSIASQSFNRKTTDNLSVDITDIVKNWYNETFMNNGVVVSFKNSEISAANYPNTTLQFYSSDTNTIYEPQLYISWTGSVSYATGSLTAITYNDFPIVYSRNFHGEYKQGRKIRIMLAARDKYPRKTFSQNSNFTTVKALPKNSYYQVLDAHNNNILIPYSNATKISADSNGAYFDLYTTMMYPERYYKFEIKSEFTDITEYFSSNDFTFKIIE
jgi:hypothetical protein